MKVLVFCPLHPGYGMKPQTAASLASLIKPPMWEVHTMIYSKDQPHESWEAGAANKNITHRYNEARRVVLDDNFDYLLTIEADMIIPADALVKLWGLTAIGLDADVAYASYVFRRLQQLNLTKDIDQYGRTQYDAETIARYWDWQIESAGLGLGCTLVKRRVLEEIEFRLYEKAPGMLSCDWRFAVDCKEHGFKQVTDLGVLCGHIDGDTVLWPQKEEPFFNLEYLNQEMNKEIVQHGN